MSATDERVIRVARKLQEGARLDQREPAFDRLNSIQQHGYRRWATDVLAVADSIGNSATPVSLGFRRAPWRTGDKMKRAIYERVFRDAPSDDDRFIGLMDSKEDAELIVALHNAHPDVLPDEAAGDSDRAVVEDKERTREEGTGR